MNFISKLYFGAFKRIGNLRLMFVISCVFAIWAIIFGISTFYEYRDVYHDVYDRSTNIEYFDQHLELRYFWHPERKSMFSAYDAENMEKIKSFYITRMCESDQHVHLLSVVNSWWWDNGIHNDTQELCKKHSGNMRVEVYSYIGLVYRLLVIVLWFYLPFIIFLLLKSVVYLPIKFVADGYKQDKRKKK